MLRLPKLTYTYTNANTYRSKGYVRICCKIVKMVNLDLEESKEEKERRENNFTFYFLQIIYILVKICDTSNNTSKIMYIN